MMGDKMDIDWKDMEWKEMKCDVSFQNTQELAAFVEYNTPKDCSIKIKHQLAVAFDEIYSNVVKYSKAEKIMLRIGTADHMVILEFIDDGIQYDPLKSADPDVTVQLQERQIGGLGLLIVKNTMDYLDYHYQDGRNHFLIGKMY